MKKKNVLIVLTILMLLLASLLSACTKVEPKPSAPVVVETQKPEPTATPTATATATTTPAPSQTIMPSESPIQSEEPVPTSTPPPENASYIPFYDMYIDLTVTDSLSRDIIYWAEKGERTAVLEEQNVLTSVDTDKKVMYLSFNLGYEHVRNNTEALLEILDERDIKAVFFMVGEFIQDFPDKVRNIYEHGHTLGCHSYFHFPPSYTMTDEEYIEDFIKTEELLRIALQEDYTRMHFYRPISAEFCERDLYIARQLGYQTVLFNATYADWDRTKPNGMDYAYNELKKDVQSGAIYQLHIVTPDNIEALPVFLDEMMADGWSFELLEQNN